MPTAISLVTLLTDFGERDHFVASMKGVILGINPQARLVDLSHQVAPHDVEEAAYLLKSCYRYFPDGTVHLVVVDPGVGSSRRALLVSTSRHFFLAPDNGVLSYVLAEEGSAEVRQIENRQYRLDAEGATFEGRDLFAPSAAWLTRGQVPGSFGRLVYDAVRFPIPEPAWRQQRLVGRIAHVDHFGNLISDLDTDHVSQVRRARGDGGLSISLADTDLSGLVSCYDDGPAGMPAALINSNGYVEIFVKGGRAADLLKARRGDPVALF